jgi:hypothetical protein
MLAANAAAAAGRRPCHRGMRNCRRQSKNIFQDATFAGKSEQRWRLFLARKKSQSRESENMGTIEEEENKAKQSGCCL